MARRVLFRFGFIYLVIFTFPGPIDPIGLGDLFTSIWERPVGWVARHVFHVAKESPLMRGSDTTYSWVFMACALFASAIGAALWTALDRKGTDHPKLARGARVYLRYYLALSILGYGIYKVLKSQFPYPELSAMIAPFGSQSPMELLWNFMGYSTGYTVFTGALEVLGAGLLLFRRTVTLGALVLAAVLANVVMLNWCYDVPVKQSSAHYFLFSLVLLIPQARRLARFFFTNQPVEPDPAEPAIVTSKWAKRALVAFQVGIVAWVVVPQTRNAYAQWKDSSTPMPAWCGLYEAQAFTSSDDAAAKRWRRIIVYPDGLVVQRADDSLVKLIMKRDEKAGTMKLSLEAPKGELHYALADGSLSLEGDFLGDRIDVRLKHADAPPFRLSARRMKIAHDSYLDQLE